MKGWGYTIQIFRTDIHLQMPTLALSNPTKVDIPTNQTSKQTKVVENITLNQSAQMLIYV